uniref:Protein C22orf25 n=1 Tax=Lepeophtheirus salmonis TaxID=72036 RepID=D3PFU6_LEPSM|nr:protein C22orf25 [Lepeophtheirus salmonis]
MCIIFCYVNPSPSLKTFKLIMIMNRDEHFDRPTSSASWEDGILCGRDEKVSSERGGTWCAINEEGKIGFLTNIFTGQSYNRLSRGSLIIDYLKEGKIKTSMDYLNELSKHGNVYNPLNLFLMSPNAQGSFDSFYYCPGLEDHIQNEGPLQIHDSFIGLSNHPLSSPYRKTSTNLHKFSNIVHEYNDTSQQSTLTESLFNALQCTDKCYPDPQIEKQCLNPSFRSRYEFLTSLFILSGPGSTYGTRSQTLILIDYFDNVYFTEKTRMDASNTQDWSTVEKYSIIKGSA